MAASQSAPGRHGRRAARPASTLMRVPWSRAAANCRSARATASPSTPAATTPAALLDGRCDVVLSGTHPASALLDHDALRSRGTAGRQFGAAARLHQPGDHPPCRWQLRDHGRPAGAARQLAADRRRRTLRAGAAPLRHADRRRDAHRARCADACDQHRRPAHDPPCPMAAGRRAARRHRASGHGAAAAGHGDTGRLFPPGSDRRRSIRSPQSPPPTPEKAVMPFMDPAFAMVGVPL